MARIELKHVTIGRGTFRNFSGEARKFNDEGKRNFCVFLTEEQADYLRGEGIAVKTLAPRDPEDEPLRFIRIKVNPDSNFPPRFYIYTGTKGNYDRSELDCHECGTLDRIDIREANLEFNVSSMGGLYLNELHVLVADDRSSLSDWDD